jgi:hypothetical protein
VVTADPWAYLIYLASQQLPKAEARIAIAYIQQALDFFRAAENPRLASRPLLYYYSFLNLAKAALLMRRVPLPMQVQHGISYPKTNTGKRLYLTKQTVSVPKAKAGHSEVFAELLCQMDAAHACDRTWKVLDLVAQMPSVHRTYTRVTNREPRFFPIKEFDVLRGGGKIWARLSAKSTDHDVARTKLALQRRPSFKTTFVKVAGKDKEIWYETQQVKAHGAGLDTGIATLAASVRAVGISAILTSSGFRYYASLTEPKEFMPYLAATYAVAYYLGSITRYQPQDFDKIIGGKYLWLVEEFVATAPTQFVYGLASWLAGYEVVRPFASL